MARAEFVAASAAAPDNKKQPKHEDIGTFALLKTNEWNKNRGISPLPSKFHTKYGLDLSWTLQWKTF